MYTHVICHNFPFAQDFPLNPLISFRHGRLDIRGGGGGGWDGMEFFGTISGKKFLAALRAELFFFHNCKL